MARPTRYFAEALPSSPPRRSLFGRAAGCLKPFLFLAILVGLCGALFYFGNPSAMLTGSGGSTPKPIAVTETEDNPNVVTLDLVQATAYNTDTIDADSLLADLLMQPSPEPKRIVMLWSPVNLLGEDEESAVPLMVLAVDGSTFTASDLDGDVWQCNAETLKVDDCRFVEWNEVAPNDGLAASAQAILTILAREAEGKVEEWVNSTNN